VTGSYATKLDQLRYGSLDPATFGHADHIGVACEILSGHEFFEALHIYSTGIRAMAAWANLPEKFNATITLAFLSLIAERMATRDHDGPEDFIKRNPDFMDRALLRPWYSATRIQSPLARRIALLPDARHVGV